MLIVVEGASAAGKTTWCRRFAAGRTLFEGEPIAGPEPAGASEPHPVDPRASARYWTEVNARRWTRARAMSDQLGWIACDTDPFKLHWSWTLWVAGLAPLAYWAASREYCRSAFANGTLGFSDLVLFADLDAATLRSQKTNDPTRARSRHDLHIRIAPALKQWYVAMAQLDPERILFRLPEDGLEPAHFALGPRTEQSGVALFDRFMSELNKG